MGGNTNQERPDQKQSPQRKEVVDSTEWWRKEEVKLSRSVGIWMVW